MFMRRGPHVGRIILDVTLGYLSQAAKLAAVATALTGTGCGDAGYQDQAVSSADGSEPTGETEDALTGCKTICIPKFGCSTICPPPPPPSPIHESATPDFYITHVVYAPPGKSSNVSYSSSTKVGSTTSCSKGFKQGISVKAEASSSVLGGSGVSVSTSASGSSNRTDALDMSLTYSQGYIKTGQVDGIDHNYDEIWFLVHPRLDFSYFASDPNTITWKFGPQDGVTTGIPYFVYAGEMNNAMVMRDQVKRDLDFWKITPSMYPKILAADPLFTGTTPNMTMNPARFTQVGVYPYLPPFMSGDLPSMQSFSIGRSNKTTTTNAYDFDYSVGVGVTVGANFGLVSTKLSVDATWTWTASSSNSHSNETGSTDAFTVGQPAFGYSGPTLLHAYVDNVFGTYAFTLDYPQGETNLALGRPSWQSSDLPGYGAVASRVNDGNTDGNFWDGSVNHTDAGYTYWGGGDAPGQAWYVDLGAEHVVNGVKIFNRTDCCSERLSHYDILAWDSNTYTWKVVSNHANDDTSGIGFFNLPINMVRTQYVMLAKTDDNYLHVAEVQVMGF